MKDEREKRILVVNNPRQKKKEKNGFLSTSELNAKSEIRCNIRARPGGSAEATLWNIQVMAYLTVFFCFYFNAPEVSLRINAFAHRRRFCILLVGLFLFRVFAALRVRPLLRRWLGTQKMQKTRQAQKTESVHVFPDCKPPLFFARRVWFSFALLRRNWRFHRQASFTFRPHSFLSFSLCLSFFSCRHQIWTSVCRCARWNS